ncbi:hypothetical protein Leryth_010634 [Lithospermum erythrorhizon]|nr:hypothetical protein Leryth_010634 [Lithospermum erythrorhizon]
MGAAPSSKGTKRNDHNKLLSSLMRRNKKSVVHNYQTGFSGFAARLSNEEVKSIARTPGVVSVFPDPILKLHTTRSWDFLKYQTDIIIDSSPSSASNGGDSIIGILDTGIWPESESFNDKGMDPIPARWKGTCMEGHNFTTSNCNRKLIGARYYSGSGSSSQGNGSPRDENGHGTHTASTAAGRPVSNASYYGLATGTASGGSPLSRIAVYRVCTSEGCRGSSILKAFEDAITDGVDVLSLSLGASGGSEPSFSNDPIAIGSFHAVEKGITVVCSAGNDGPDAKTVVNVAPWIITVAATTIDRDFETDIVLGGNKVIKGGGISFGNIQSAPAYSLLYGALAKSDSGNVDATDARNCIPGSLDNNTVRGKIVICQNDDGEYSPREKKQSVMDMGGIGIILIDDNARSVSSNYGSFPMAAVTSKDGSEILSYINSTSEPIATILPTKTIGNYKPAPTVAYFSSRGPSPVTKNIIKPDIAAPGVNILAAWLGNDAKITLSHKEPPLFNIISGTSMSCPHVSGLAGTVKSQNPSWGPSAIRSAIMTTAIQTNNLKSPTTTNSGSVATPYDIGAGEVSISGPLHPGLVYETEEIDYLLFLCNTGYNISDIKLIASTIPSGFSCPTNSSEDSISNINYPSIAISNIQENKSKKVTRTVTNVGEDESTYTVLVDAPTGIKVEVVPNKLQFTKVNEKQTYEVTFTLTSTPNDYTFGYITWSNEKYRVRCPFIVST